MKFNWQYWLIMTADGIFTRGRYIGNYQDGIVKCDEIYGHSGYKLTEDNRNQFHPINRVNVND